tara:strand:+ start:107 stop:334 length:228 start_codon:yes stop_codon:yes gene_type:complete
MEYISWEYRTDYTAIPNRVYLLSTNDKTYLATPHFNAAMKAKSYLKTRGIRSFIKLENVYPIIKKYFTTTTEENA